MSTAERTSALKKVWWIERDAIAIATRSDSDSSTDYVSVSEVKTVNVHAVKRDEDFVASGTGIALAESPAIPTEFHDALAYYAISKGYEKSPEGIAQAKYFKGEFFRYVKEGIEFASTGRTSSTARAVANSVASIR